MNKYNLIIGSHVSLSSPDFLLGAVKEAISYESNTFMIYTGAPQNTIRKDIKTFKIKEAFDLMEKQNIKPSNVIVHAPYIINLASSKPETRQLAKEFLVKELERVDGLGFNKIVLHPGSRLEQTYEEGINLIAEGINFAFANIKNQTKILLETMAGKGTELGNKIDDIKNIFDKVEEKQRLGVCLDTCHISDAGYNLDHFDEYLKVFDEKIGIDKIECIHINDSMNECGARKDRHQNIGYGKIGFENLLKVIYHPKLDSIPKILETPYVKYLNTYIPPYKQEIEMIRNQKFFDWIKKLNQ